MFINNIDLILEKYPNIINYELPPTTIYDFFSICRK